MTNTKKIDSPSRLEALLFGTPIYVMHSDGEQVRKHHKRRINKKWRKRYGVYHSCVPDGQVIALDLDGKKMLIMTEKTYRRVKRIAVKI